MRTIIDIPEDQLSYLAQFCEQQGISRAEAIRQAVQKMKESSPPPTSKQAAREAFFGIWKDRDDIGDSVEYQRKLRSEWDREWDPD